MSVSDYTVLVVEDHDFQRRTMLQILANLGAAELLEAADGEAALALLDAGRVPDVVVCDLDLPGMDGVEVVRRIADRHPGLGVVFASGLDDQVIDAAEATAREYSVTVLGALRKPLTARALHDAIDRFQGGAPEGAGGE